MQFIRTPGEHYFLNFFINIPFCSQIETNNRCFTYASKEGILQLSTLANYLYNFFSIHFRHFWSVVFADDFWRLSIKWAEWQLSARNQKSKGFLKRCNFPHFVCVLFSAICKTWFQLTNISCLSYRNILLNISCVYDKVFVKKKLTYVSRAVLPLTKCHFRQTLSSEWWKYCCYGNFSRCG